MFGSLITKARAPVVTLLLGVFALALPAAAQVTSLTMQSEPGDYIGGGQSYSYTPASATFSINSAFNNSVNVSVYATDGNWWFVDFSAPNGALLAPGAYLNAMRWPFQDPGSPGLSVSGSGRGCNTLTGSFQVLQVTYAPGNVIASFDATFEQHCEGGAPALRGEIRYNANVALYVTAPSSVQAVQGQNVSFLVTGTDAQQRRVYLTATQLPPGASFVDNGNSTGSFAWSPSTSQSGSYVAIFQGDNHQGNVATSTTQFTVVAPAPRNDDFATPTLIPASPARYTQDATNATAASDDPWCFGNAQSVWFAYTAPANASLEANTFGSGYDTTLSVYTGSRGALTQLACNDDANNTLQSRVRFQAVKGTTYYFMAASLYNPVTPANLVFNLQPGPPPFSFNPSVAQFGSVQPSTGAVTLSGSVQCSQPAYVTLSGQLKQKRGNTAVTGYWSAFVPCDGVTKWTASVQSQTQLFKGRSALLFAGGKAEVGATATAVDPDSGVTKQVNFKSTVTLRGK